jgi:hypothetical protein
LIIAYHLNYSALRFVAFDLPVFQGSLLTTNRGHPTNSKNTGQHLIAQSTQ